MTVNQLSYLNYVENARHNATTEGLEASRQAETHRANVQGEAMRAQELQEAIRSHLATESLRGQELNETHRHNVATETETYRANVTREGLERQKIDVQRADVQIKSAQLEETKRHNEAFEMQQLIDAGLRREQFTEQKDLNDKYYAIDVDKLSVDAGKAQHEKTKTWVNFAGGIVSRFLS